MKIMYVIILKCTVAPPEFASLRAGKATAARDVTGFSKLSSTQGFATSQKSLGFLDTRIAQKRWRRIKSKAENPPNPGMAVRNSRTS